MPQVRPLRPRVASHRHSSTKVLLAEGEETAFKEHCRNYENEYRLLQTEIQKLKNQMQELHRDLTKHHSLINTDPTKEILERSMQIHEQIEAQYSTMLTLRVKFEEACKETLQKVTNEQEIYEAQLHDLLQLKQENSYLMTIARHIRPYIQSIAKVKELLDTRFQEVKNPEDDGADIMLRTSEDDTEAQELQHSFFAACSRDSHRNKKAGI